MNIASSNCLEFRREKLADPNRVSPSAQAHLADCALCQAFARRIDGMERALADCLEVPIPEGLADRIILRAQSGQKTSPAWKTWALAASMTFFSVIGLSAYLTTTREARPLSLAEAAAEHAGDETLEMAFHTSERPERIGAIFASFGGQVEAPIGEVRYIHLCPIKDHGMGWHIVYQTPTGKITLLLVASKTGDPESQVLNVGGKMVRVQRAGQGYYALIAETMPALDAAQRDLQSKVKWL